jgi:transposase-like protein
MQSRTGNTTRAAARRSKIKPPDRCPHCNSKRIIKKGTRKKKLEDVSLYRCRSCGRPFSPGPRAIRNKTYPLPEILEAFTLYDRGNTLEATAEKISSRYGHHVAPSTISRWLAEHPAAHHVPPHSRTRSTAVQPGATDLRPRRHIPAFTLWVIRFSRPTTSRRSSSR